MVGLGILVGLLVTGWKIAMVFQENNNDCVFIF